MKETCKRTRARGLACSASLMIAASILGLTHHENPHSAVWIRREKQTLSRLSLQRSTVAESDGSQVAARWHASSSPGTRPSTKRRRINNELRMTLIHRRHRVYGLFRRDRWPNVRNGAVEPSSRSEQRITDISAWIQRRHSSRTRNDLLTPWVKNLPDPTTKTNFSADFPRVISPPPPPPKLSPSSSPSLRTGHHTRKKPLSLPAPLGRKRANTKQKAKTKDKKYTYQIMFLFTRPPPSQIRGNAPRKPTPQQPIRTHQIRSENRGRDLRPSAAVESRSQNQNGRRRIPVNPAMPNPSHPGPSEIPPEQSTPRLFSICNLVTTSERQAKQSSAQHKAGPCKSAASLLPNKALARTQRPVWSRYHPRQRPIESSHSARPMHDFFLFTAVALAASCPATTTVAGALEHCTAFYIVRYRAWG